MIAWSMVAVPLSSVVAGPVSGELLEMDEIAGWPGGMAVSAPGVAGRGHRAGDAEGARRSARAAGRLTDREREVVRDRRGATRGEECGISASAQDRVS